MSTTHKLKSTGPRMIACSSLRPGSWLRDGDKDDDYVVTKNVEHRQIIQALNRFAPHEGGDNFSYGYLVEHGFIHLGTGTRRRWWKWLPKWAQGMVCEWRKP